MSLGWLTQSTIYFEKKKPIEISDSTLIGIQAEIHSAKQAKNNNAKGSSKLKSNIKKKNIGIQQRIRKDESHRIENQTVQSYNSLQRKCSNIYSKLSELNQNHQNLLVDFILKNLNKGGDEYQQSRDEFYSGKLKDLRDYRGSLLDGQPQQDLRQRLNWQKQVFQELKMGSCVAREKVLQSFDKKLSQGEKEALRSVLEELGEESEKKKQMMNRRLHDEEEKSRKQRKLNEILKSVKKDKI